jgi:hypothetical protein
LQTRKSLRELFLVVLDSVLSASCGGMVTGSCKNDQKLFVYFNQTRFASITWALEPTKLN